MAFLIPTSSASTMVQIMQAYMSSSCTLMLYTNDVTPALTHSYGSFTGASNMSGVSCMNFYTSTSSAAGTATISSTPVTLTQTMAGTQTVYGWYVANGSTLLFAERFTATASLVDSGDGVAISGHKFLLHQ